MSRDFYTLAEAARILEVTQRRVLEMLETGELAGERDLRSSRWMIPKHTVQELVPEPLSDDPLSENPALRSSDHSTKTVQQLVEELGNLQRELGRVRNRLELARQAEHTEWKKRAPYKPSRSDGRRKGTGFKRNWSPRETRGPGEGCWAGDVACGALTLSLPFRRGSRGPRGSGLPRRPFRRSPQRSPCDP
jgi:excisionase family DNA binding protein